MEPNIHLFIKITGATLQQIARVTSNNIAEKRSNITAWLWTPDATIPNLCIHLILPSKRHCNHVSGLFVENFTNQEFILFQLRAITPKRSTCIVRFPSLLSRASPRFSLVYRPSSRFWICQRLQQARCRHQEITFGSILFCIDILPGTLYRSGLVDKGINYEMALDCYRKADDQVET